LTEVAIRSIPVWIWLVFVLASSAELYFFLMQRSALEVCRANGLPDKLRLLMMPPSYALTWLVVPAKWLCAALLAWHVSILAAALAVGASFLATTFVPVPHRFFLPAFEARLVSLDPSNFLLVSQLLDAVRRARAQLAV